MHPNRCRKCLSRFQASSCQVHLFIKVTIVTSVICGRLGDIVAGIHGCGCILLLGFIPLLYCGPDYAILPFTLCEKECCLSNLWSTSDWCTDLYPRRTSTQPMDDLRHGHWQHMSWLNITAATINKPGTAVITSSTVFDYTEQCIHTNINCSKIITVASAFQY